MVFGLNSLIVGLVGLKPPIKIALNSEESNITHCTKEMFWLLLFYLHHLPTNLLLILLLYLNNCIYHAI